MSSDNVVLRVKNISKCFEMYEKPIHRLFQTLCAGRKNFYREFWALQDINLEVCKGECIGIIGKNGAGKSTLLQIITGTLQATSGVVETHGRIAALLELGSGFNSEFTGRENVYMNGAILGMTKEEIDAKYQSILDFADIGEFIDQPVKTYSSGMMVRLAFAVQVAVEPEILIVDEALAVGDIAFQAKCFKRIQELRERNTTILFVTHDLESIVRYCTRAYLFNNGQVYASGTPIDIVNTFKQLMAQKISALYEAPVLPEQSGAEPESEKAAVQNLPVSKDCEDYGDRKAVITAYRILDDKGKVTTELLGEKEYLLQMEIHANERIEAPIAAFTLRDTSGLEVCGTNTLYEQCDIPPWDPGTDHLVEFYFVPCVQTRGYILLLGCTEYTSEGLAVHHRLYDVCTLNIENTRRFTGLFKMPGRAVYRKMQS